MFPLAACLRGAVGYMQAACALEPNLNSICIFQVDNRYLIKNTRAPHLPLLLSKTLTEADQMTFPGNKASRLYVFKSTW